MSDVKLLKAWCEAFQQEFESHGKFNPMAKCVTIASACHRYWRKMHLPTNTIPVEPPRGWHGSRNNQSVKALKWLSWCEQLLHQDDTNVSFASFFHNHFRICVYDRNLLLTALLMLGTEVNWAYTPLPVSFMWRDMTSQPVPIFTIYELHGCIFQGCPNCYLMHNQISKLNPDRTVQEMYEATLAKTALLRAMGYTVLEKWECEWDREIKTDATLDDFVANFEIVEPLEPCDAFFGGKTNAVTLYHKADESVGGQIKYVDVTFLYPYINKYGEYPVGHPEIITLPKDQNIHSYFGLAKVDILPPNHLYHPVLPYRCGGNS